MTFGSLCAGIGGFDLGLERAGLTCKWQVEIDPFCRRVLEKHWPHVRRYEDARDFDGRTAEPVDVVCAGFPCQPFCHHGKRRGKHDERWLWPEVDRVVGEVDPRVVLLENVSGLLHAGRGFSRILADLAARGFDAEWECLPGVAVGAPHYRERVWIVAYRPDDRCHSKPTPRVYVQGPRRDDTHGRHTYPPRRDAGEGAWRAYAESYGPQPGILREAYGLSGGLDRVAALGNAVIPDIAEFIGRRLMQSLGSDLR